MVFPDELAARINNEHIRKKLLAIAYGFTHRMDVAKDIVGETIADLLKLPEEKIGSIDNLEHYAKKIAYNKGYKWINDPENKNAIALDTSAREKGHFTDPVINFELKEIIAAVNTHRSETDKKIFALFCQDCDYSEIARSIKESESFVRRRMHEIRKWLRKHFRNEGRN